MPSVTVHLRLADTVLRRWRDDRRRSPFDPDDPDDASAFRQGAVGPDLGYMPGGHRPLSDLAHCLHTGDLTRALLRRADTSRQSAFAWGWVTHVLADTMIHPLVGCAVGELVHGSPAHFVDGDAEPRAHIRVEAGLDAIYAERHPELRRLRLGRPFDARGIAFVVDAFRDTYGAAPALRLFLRSHVVAARRAGQGLALAALSALTLPTHEPPPTAATASGGGSAGWLKARLAESCTGLAYLLPVIPPLWFLNAVRDVEENFADLFAEEFEVGGAGLANVNLDTGRRDVEERDYGGFQRSLDLIRRLGGRLPALPAPDSTPASSAA